LPGPMEPAMSHPIARHLPGRANVITHIHTNASNAEASELDLLIGEGLRRVPGMRTRLEWAECFTRVSALDRMLRRGEGERGPVHLVICTDHMRGKSHLLGEEHLRTAARQPRLALGAELATRTRDVDGCLRQGPEILAYGGVRPVQGPFGSYHGLSQGLIDELYATCLDDEGTELDTLRARDLLRRRGVAHALSHPWDGHHLSFRGTFEVISQFAFVEVINGGVFEESAEVLGAYVKLNNALLAGARVPAGLLTPTGRRIVDEILRHGRRIVPWAGSDAHARHFDRVVTAVAPDAGVPASHLTPSALFATMLAVERGASAEVPGSRRPRFVHLGEPGTPAALNDDVTRIVARNWWHAATTPALLRSPPLAARVLATAIRITRGELALRDRRQEARRRHLERSFDPRVVLPHLVMPTRAALVQAIRTRRVA